MFKENIWNEYFFIIRVQKSFPNTTLISEAIKEIIERFEYLKM